MDELLAEIKGAQMDLTELTQDLDNIKARLEFCATRCAWALAGMEDVHLHIVGEHVTFENPDHARFVHVTVHNSR